jgi:hypothetical protein
MIYDGTKKEYMCKQYKTQQKIQIIVKFIIIYTQQFTVHNVHTCTPWYRTRYTTCNRNYM